MYNLKKKVGLSVYLYYNRDARKLTKFGDVVYHSKRFRYLVLYVNQDQAERVQEDLNRQKFIKSVEQSQLDQIDQEFVGSLYREV